MTLYRPNTADEIAASWKTDSRWKGITRPYAAKDVVPLRGTLQIEYTLARLGADRLWNLLNREKYVNALGAMRALVHNAGKRADNTLTRRVEAALDAGFANGSMPA